MTSGAPQEIAAAMIELLRRPELVREMGARGRELAVERFDQSHVVRRTLEVYAAALATPRSRINRS